MQLVGMIAGRTPSCLDLQHVLADHQLWLSTNTCKENRCISQYFFFKKIMPCPFMSPKTFWTGPNIFVPYSKLIYILCQFQSFFARPKKDFHIGSKDHIFKEGRKILQNLHLPFVLCSASQK